MNNLIPVIDKIRDIFAQAGLPHQLELPQIAVVGSQSAGKSSVLEHIVGRDFLPRGTGIVTRRPLILHLVNNQDDEAQRVSPTSAAEGGGGAGAGGEQRGQAWGRFEHNPRETFTDFEAIRAEISAETDRRCPGKGIADDPIRLTVHAPDVVNLTLIDLPGLTRNPVGDQPKDIEQQIRKMCLTYIVPETTIILAVSPANVDISTSDALQMAREVDPTGNRTVGVLTKLDLMDRGTDAMDILSGKILPLQRGYIGVVNRGQKDIDGRVDIRRALQHEEEFFASHPRYRDIRHRLGTPFLAKTLNLILLQHIRNFLPTLKGQIGELISQTRTILQGLGSDAADDYSHGALLLQSLREYATEVVSAIDGTSEGRTSRDLKGGARINWIFNEGFVPFLKSINALEGLSDSAIQAEIRNAKGFRNGLFIPEGAFEHLVRLQIRQLEEPSKRCADHVFEELVEICHMHTYKLNRFPVLKAAVSEYVVTLLQEYLTPLRDHITNLVRIESAYINTHHPDFYSGGSDFYRLLDQTSSQTADPTLTPAITSGPAGAGGGGGGVTSPQQPGQQQQQQQGVGQQQGAPRAAAAVAAPAVGAGVGGPVTVQEREQRERTLIRRLVETYFDIVRKNIADGVPKATIWFLVMQLKTKLHDALLLKFNKEAQLPDLLREDDGVVTRRKSAQAMLKCLQESMAAIAEIQTFSVV